MVRGGLRWHCRRRPLLRSSGPAHWYRARSRPQQAGGIEVDRHWRALALEQAKATGGQGLLRLEGPHLDVVTHQLETDATAPGQAELLAQGLGDGDLPLAGHRAGAGGIHGRTQASTTW